MKKLQELTLFDKFLFDETMDIPEAHEAVLQIIFGDDNLKLLTPAQTEKEIRTAPWLRSIRLDVYAIDQEKRIYNTEAQKAEKKDLVKRSRFYQSLIDSSLLEPGAINFNQMNDTCIIMITPFDLFDDINIHSVPDVMKIRHCQWKTAQSESFSTATEKIRKRCHLN